MYLIVVAHYIIGTFNNDQLKNTEKGAQMRLMAPYLPRHPDHLDLWYLSANPICLILIHLLPITKTAPLWASENVKIRFDVNQSP